MNASLLPLTPDEHEILALATADTRKFAIQLGYVLPPAAQLAFERLMLAHRIRLIDISPAMIATGDSRLMRIFVVTPAGEAALAEYLKGAQ